MRSHRPSRTALKVGRSLIFVAQDPGVEPLLPLGAAESTARLMIAAGQLKPGHLRLFRMPRLRRWVAWAERHTAPGQYLYFGLRKRFLDDETRAALAAGATQVLVIGAGFDTLAVRLAAEFPEVTFVELDHPGTHAVKRAGIEALGEDRPNLHLLGVDLAATGLEEALAEVSGWHREAVSAIVAEGVLMYFGEAAVATLLQKVRSLSAAGSRLLFTYLRRDPAGRIWLGKAGRLTMFLLKAVGEPVLWGVRPEDLPEFLEQHGWRLSLPPEHFDLRRRYLEPAGLGDVPLGDIESLAVACSVA